MADDERLSDDALEMAAQLFPDTNERLDLNTATAEELEALGIFTHIQIYDLLERRRMLSGFFSEHELVCIRGINDDDVEKMLNFIYIDPNSYKEKLPMKWRQNCTVRLKRTFPKAAGYIPKNDTTSAAYKGSPFQSLLRVDGKFGQNFVYGLVAESDPGEPMFSNGISTTDFTSAYIGYKSDKTIVRQAVIGHYVVQLGQGLGFWTGFARDGSTTQSSICRRATGLRPTLSASESGYLRGGAILLGGNHLRALLFGSTTDGDATVKYDADSTAYFSTFDTDGYHRTASELAKRNNLTQNIFGVYLGRVSDQMRAHIGANTWHGSMPIKPDGQLYRLAMPDCQRLTTIHTDYQLHFDNVFLYGEAAWQSTNTLAVMQAIDVRGGRGNYVTIGYRNFGKRYYPIAQSPFSVASKPGGESGFYAAAQLEPTGKLNVQLMVNTYSNSWLLYSKPFLTDGYKLRLTSTYQFSHTSSLMLKIRYENKEVASNSSSRHVSETHKTNIRAQWTNSPTDMLKFKTAIEKVHINEADTPADNGFWMSQEVDFTFKHPSITVALLLAHFDTDDYNSRIYVYLPDVLYSMSMPSYYGRGALALARVKWNISKHVTAWFWANYVNYLDRDYISSGNNKLNSSHRLDAKVQLRVKLW